MTQPDAIITEYAEKLKEKLGDDLREIYLFGSRARGDFREGSDYDCLVIISKRTPELLDMIYEVGGDFLSDGILIASIIRTESKWQEQKYFRLGRIISREGIMIWKAA